MFGFSTYNYDTFTRDMLRDDLSRAKAFGGPEPGEKAPDFKGRTLDGETIRLSDFKGDKNVVLMFGSATCPMTAGSIQGMNELYEEYRDQDVQFLFVYVREAHPGDQIPAHSSDEEKRRAAELLREEEEIEMPMVVDEVRGPIHRKYSRLPNPTYLIDKSGRVAFRAMFTRPSVIEEALEELLERQQERGVEHAVVRGGEDRSVPMSYALLHAHRALERGGTKSQRDFRQAMGMSGRMALVTSRVAEPITEHPMRVLTAVLLTGGVITAGVIAGRKLRDQRLRSREPYDVHRGRRRRGEGPGDYEAVGI